MGCGGSKEKKVQDDKPASGGAAGKSPLKADSVVVPSEAKNYTPLEKELQPFTVCEFEPMS